MKRVYRLILLPAVMAAFILTGCAKLEEEVFSSLTPEVYYKTESDALIAVNGMYHTLNRPFIYSDDFFAMVLQPNKYVLSRVPARKPFSTFSFSATNERVLKVWSNLYTTIGRANTVIARVPGIQMADSLKASYLAEAKFLRAQSYFYLVRFFGGVPIKSEETVDMSTVHAPRSSAVEVYELIMKDLKEAALDLPDTRSANEKGRATACAAKALLGKVYLTMAGHPLNQTDKYEKARDILGEVMADKAKFGVDLLPNFADIFDVTKEATNTEEIFSIQFARITDQGNPLPFFTAPLNSNFATAYGQWAYGFTTAFRDLYEVNDKRRDVTLVSSYTAYNGVLVTYGVSTSYRDYGGIALGKYQDGPAGTAPSNVLHGNNIILLRYADVLLMYAEAENEINGPDNAYDAINEVRHRAGIDSLSGLDQRAFRDSIYIDRLRELSGELTAYFDFQRLKKLEDHVAYSYEANAEGVTFKPSMYLYPIPQNEIDFNKEISQIDQNPGY